MDFPHYWNKRPIERTQMQPIADILQTVIDLAVLMFERNHMISRLKTHRYSKTILDFQAHGVYIGRNRILQERGFTFHLIPFY